MEPTTFNGYSEAIILGNNRELLNQNIQDAGARLGWHLVHSAENILVWQTPNAELFQLSITEEKAILFIYPANEYYWHEETLIDLARQFKETFETTKKESIIKERSKHPMHREKYGALVPSKTYLVTPLILYSCILMFLVMLLFGVSPLTPTAKTLFEWGGNFGTAVVDGQWWRLFSYMFLHAGAMHLIMNGFALLYVGMFLEPLIGKSRIIFAYIFTGIAAGILSIVMHPDSVGVGASGAIFGLYGVFFSLLTTNYLQKTARKTMLRSLLFFIVFNLMMGLQGNTDNAAHIGGLISGIALGYLFYPGIKRKSDSLTEAKIN